MGGHVILGCQEFTRVATAGGCFIQPRALLLKIAAVNLAACPPLTPLLPLLPYLLFPISWTSLSRSPLYLSVSLCLMQSDYVPFASAAKSHAGAAGSGRPPPDSRLTDSLHAGPCAGPAPRRPGQHAVLEKQMLVLLN